MMKESDRAYLAGFIDGEGCITTRIQNKNTGSVNVLLSCSQSKKEIIDWIQSEIPGNYSIQSMKSPNPKNPDNARPCHTWYVTGEKALLVLVSIVPYMRVKKEQALLAIELLETCHPGPGRKATEQQYIRASQIREAISTLNHRGV